MDTLRRETSPNGLSNSSVVKTLESDTRRDEQKDLEHEEPANNEQFEEREECSPPPHGSSLGVGLSSRASDIKQYLQNDEEVKAISLKSDGSAQEIVFNLSAAATRKLLRGRPSIVGEIEELKVVVVQALDSSNDAEPNKHTLPVPLCHNRCNGDYVVFRMDSAGKAVDVSLEEYQKYAEGHKTQTESALKNYSADTKQIKSHSPFESMNTDISMEGLRGALENALSAESVSLDGTKQNDPEIGEAVQQGLQKIIDDAVNALSSSPMDDPDYEPSGDREESPSDADGVAIEETFDGAVDERPWRSQLKDALDHVQQIGKLDGEIFAERIWSTFYELNGIEPALCQMNDLFNKIRAEFANEAEEELDDEESEGSETESEDEVEIEVGDDWEATLGHIREIGRADGAALAEGICAALREENGAEPTLSQLADLWQWVQEEFATEALEESETDGDSDSDIGGSSEMEEALHHVRELGAEDGEELALNLCQIMAEENGAEPSLSQLTELWQWIQDQFAMEAAEETEDDEAQSISLPRSESVVGEDWLSRANHLYLNQKGRMPTERELVATVRSFANELAHSVMLGDHQEVDSENAPEEEQRSGDEADDEEETKNASDDEYDPQNTSDQELARFDGAEDLKHQTNFFGAPSMLNTPMVQSKSGDAVSWNVYFNEEDLNRPAESKNLKRAIEGFKRRNQKEPSLSQLKQMATFLAVPNEVCDEEDFIEPATIATARVNSKVFVSDTIDKKTASSFSVYLETKKQGLEEGAIRCFRRINGRDPAPEELTNLKEFVRTEQQLTEKAFFVAPQQPLFFSSHSDSGRRAAMSYTLNFEQREQGDEESALKWFKRFNKREPDEAESLQIRHFLNPNHIE